MQIHFTGHQMEVTPALKAFTQEKLDKLKKHSNAMTAIHVIFKVEKLQQVVEATIMVAKGELHAKADATDMYAAIDSLIDKLDRQLLKHKEKTKNHRE